MQSDRARSIQTHVLIYPASHEQVSEMVLKTILFGDLWAQDYPKWTPFGHRWQTKAPRSSQYDIYAAFACVCSCWLEPGWAQDLRERAQEVVTSWSQAQYTSKQMAQIAYYQD